MPFPYKLAAIDLDGTLLGPDHKVSPANCAALEDLQVRGVKTVIASGRRFQNSLRLYRQLGLTGPIIACQGALVMDPQTNEIFEEHYLPAALADAMVAEGQARGFSVIYYSRHHLYAKERDQWVQLYESRINESTELLPDLHSLAGADALKVVWYGDPARLLAARPELEATYRGRVDVLSTDRENLEFMTPGIDKGVGLRAAVKHYGIKLEETLAFGDSENDVPMLRLAGLGVAMDGGTKLAHDAAAMIAPVGPHEDSFARAVAAVIQHADAIA